MGKLGVQKIGSCVMMSNTSEKQGKTGGVSRSNKHAIIKERPGCRKAIIQVAEEQGVKVSSIVEHILLNKHCYSDGMRKQAKLMEAEPK